MAENEPPLSVQMTNQKSDGLDIDNDKGGKEAIGAQTPMETSDMEEGEIITTDDETMDGLTEIRKQLEQELSKEETIGALKEDVEAEDLLDVKKATATSNKLGINFGLLAECKKVNTDKVPSSKKPDSSKHSVKSNNKDNKDNRSRSDSQDSRRERDRERKKSNEKGSTTSDRDRRKSNEKNSNSKDDRSRDYRKSNERTPNRGDNQRDWGRKNNDKFGGKGNYGRDSSKNDNRSCSRGFGGSGDRDRHDKVNDRGNRSRDQRSNNNRANTPSSAKGKPSDTSKNHNNQGKRISQKEKDSKKTPPKSNLNDEKKEDALKCPYKVQIAEKVDLSKENLNKSNEKDKSVEETDSDKIDEVLDNLEEMTCSSSSENEKVSKSDGDISKDIPAPLKRKHSTENTKTEQNQESTEPPNKKSKVDDDNNEDNLDETRTFPSTEEFQIIDDIGMDEQENGEKESENDEVVVNNTGGDNVEDGEYVSSEDELDDNEIYSWLEDGINKKTISKEIDYLNLEPVDQKEKFVLVERGIDPFEVLPEGWVCVTHNSGMPTYLHKASRVVTLSKPYFLGSGSVRRHDIPLSAIPCLQYRRQLQKESPSAIKQGNVNCQNNQKSGSLNGSAVVIDESNVQSLTDINGASQNTQPLMNGEFSGTEAIQQEGETQNATSLNKQSLVNAEINVPKTKDDSGSQSKQSEIIANEDMPSIETNQSSENDIEQSADTNLFEMGTNSLNAHSGMNGELPSSEARENVVGQRLPSAEAMSLEIMPDSDVQNSLLPDEDKNKQKDTEKTEPVIGAVTPSPVNVNGIYEAIPLESSEAKIVSGDESSEQKESSQDDTTDLDKTLTFEEKGDDSSCLDTTKTEGEKTADGLMAGPPVKIESVAEKKLENSVSAEELQDYCKGLFEFKMVTVKKFKTWRERRKHLNAIRRKKTRPALPSKTKLITCEIPVPKDSGSEKPKKKEFVLNPAGKSPVCILHEYAQHTLKIQPRYRFLELENAQNPYSAIVLVNNVEYGKGFASSKKLAKMNAAKETLKILIPGMTKIWDEDDDMEDMSFFDEIKVDDPRVSDLCTKTGQPSPYQILLECLKRNYGMGDTHVKTEVKPLKHQKSEYTLTVGKHSVNITCKNKREGKQRAAQAMLGQLHPYINCIGSLLRLYGQSFGRELKEKKKEEESVTELQTHTQANRPNIALLDKLRKEMSKLQARRTAVTSKGSLLIDKVPTGITSLDL